MPTYKEQYDKIIQAYFRDEIKPYRMSFCFCGTLTGGNSWTRYIDNSWSPYKGKEFSAMENALLSTIKKLTIGGDPLEIFLGAYGQREVANHPNYETALFEGMCAALEVLKEIHISRGEKIDEEIPQFTKRNLSTNKENQNELSAY